MDSGDIIKIATATGLSLFAVVVLIGSLVFASVSPKCAKCCRREESFYAAPQPVEGIEMVQVQEVEDDPAYHVYETIDEARLEPSSTISDFEIYRAPYDCVAVLAPRNSADPRR